MEQERIVLDQNLLSHASQEVRAEFIRKTYSHLALAFLLFIGIEALFLNTPFIVELGLKMTQGFTWLLVLGGFMLVTNMAEKWAANAGSKNMQYGGFLLYIVAEAFLFVPLLYIAMSYSGNGTELLMQAFVTTLFLFGALSAVVLYTKKDFSFLRSALMVGGILAIGLIVAGTAFGFNLGLAFSFGMVALAAGSILYQTSNLVHKYDTSQYVVASLGLFASFMLLLWYVIQIFMSRD